MESEPEKPLPPLSGPYLIARLLAGLPLYAPFTLVSRLPDPYGLILFELLRCPPDSLHETLDFILSQYPDGDRFRAAIESIDPHPPFPGLTVPADISPDLFGLPAGAFPAVPPEAALPGDWAWSAPDSFWLKDYDAFAYRAAPMADRAFNLAMGLFILSAAIARRVCLPVGIQRVFPNLYMLAIAPSTIHRKSTAFQTGLSVIRAAGLDLLLLPGRQSPESLLAEMSEAPPSTFNAWTAAERDRWLAERPFAAQRGWLLDEASHLIDALGSDSPGSFLPLLLSLYDCPDREVIHTLSRGRQAVLNSYLTFYGAVTPSTIQAHLAAESNWTNGLWARFALITPLSPSPEWRFFPPALSIPQPLIDHLHHLAFAALPQPSPPRQRIEASTNPLIDGSTDRPVDAPRGLPLPLIATAPDCLAAWSSYAKATSHDLLLEGHIDRRLWASYGRLHIMAIKIAILVAASDWAALPPGDRPPAPRVTLAHWYRGQALAESWRASLHRLVAAEPASAAARHEDTVLRLIERAGERGLTLRELRQYGHLDHETVSRQVSHLCAESVVEKYTPPGGKTTYYHLLNPKFP